MLSRVGLHALPRSVFYLRRTMAHDLIPAQTSVEWMRHILDEPFTQAAQRFLEPQSVVSKHGNASVKDCLVSMDKSHVRCCFVTVDGEDDNSVTLSPRHSVRRPDQEVIKSRFRLFDMRDALATLLRKEDKRFERLERQHAGRDEHDSSSINQLSKSDYLQSGVKAVLASRAQDVANISGHNNYIPCWEDDSFQTVIRAFRSSPRVPIFRFRPDTRCLSLLRVFSATDLFQLLNKSSFFENLDDKSLLAFDKALSSAAPRQGSSLAVASESDPLLRTIRRLVKSGYSALPIVSEVDSQRSLGVISVRDFRCLLLRPQALNLPGDIPLLASTMTFVSHVRQLECLKAKYPSISVKESTPLRQVVLKMLTADIQRICLVDERGKLTGLFSRTDLGRLVARVVEQLIADS